jgi:transcriptional regulator with XRE-family HTH domain
MSLREAFAANLTRLCRGAESVAAVCRATKINRQQFDRYLSGGSLPNQRNRDKICHYFKIDEQTLFQENNGSLASDPIDRGAQWLPTDMRSALKLLHSNAGRTISPGIYFLHFVIPQEQNSIMRSTLVVKADGDLMTFRRLTGLSERKGSWWSNFVGDHKGVILERTHGIYLIGLNTRGANHEPTFVVLHWIAISQAMWGGQAMILTPSGPTITAVVLNPCEKAMGLRQALRASHVYSADDPCIDPMVVDALDQQRQGLMAMTRNLDLSVRALHTPDTVDP